jgi:hypothetical protein
LKKIRRVSPALPARAVLAMMLTCGSIFAVKADGNSVPTLSAASALNTPLGVRSYGMGMAQTGNANDLSAMYYNPAALGSINYFEYGLSYHSAGNDVAGHSLLVSIPLPYGTIGLSGVFNTSQDNEYVSGGVNALPDRNKYSYIAGISYGAPVWVRKINAGMTLKWFGADFSSAAAGVAYPQQQKGLFIDLALLGTFDPAHYSDRLRWLPRISGGFAARNLHPKFNMDNEVSNAENREEYNAGISLQFPYKLMLNVDVVNSVNVPTRMRYGLEYWPGHFIAFRGGVTHSSDGSLYKSIHWGIGFGETVQASKLSFEYSGAKEYPDGFGLNFEQPNATYHRFAFHHSFETIDVTDKRVTPVRYTERYSHRYRFSRALSPGEIIADTVTVLPSEAGGFDDAVAAAESAGPIPVVPPSPEHPKPNIVGRYWVAVFPVTVDVIAGRVKNISLKEKIRGNYLIEVNRGGAGRLVNAFQLQKAPAQQQGELESAYLSRVQQAVGADLIVFTKLYVDGNTGNLKVMTLYYRRGDKGISAQDEVVGSDAEELDFLRKSSQKFAQEHVALLGEFR